MKSEFAMSDVVAIRAPTSIWLPLPNRRPFPLISHTCPLANMLPSMSDGLVPVTRLRVMADALGWMKLTEESDEIENVFQLMTARSLDCVMTVEVPDGVL